MLKYRINCNVIGFHYVWCSPVFEGKARARGSLGSDQAASSDPATIYRRLYEDVRSRDRHSNEIERQRVGLKSAALILRSSNKITEHAAREIAAMTDAAGIEDFTPILYAIPYEKVADRVELVEHARRAGLEPEYIISDLVDGEFEMIEPLPWR